MIYIVFIILIILLCFYFILFKMNILSPTVIACAMFIVSSFFALLNAHTWQITIAPITVVIIVTSLIAFASGEVLVNLIFYKHKQRIQLTVPQSPISVSKLTLIIICSMSSLLLVHYYNQTVTMAEKAGYIDGPLMLMYARTASLNHTIIGRDSLASHARNSAEAVAYIFSYIFLYNAVFFKGKKNIVNLLPILLYIPYIILTTGRTKFIYLITFWIIIGSILFMQKKQWQPKYTLRIILIGISGLFIFFVLFLLSGSLKGNGAGRSAYDMISLYAGSSIPALDDFVLNPRPPDVYFGENTLFGIYYFLRRIGFSIPQFYAPYDYVRFTGMSTNIYTAIRRYLEDFGVLGLYCILFSLGFFYSFLFLKVNNTRGFLLIVYASIFYPIVEISIEERFFMSIISTETVFLIMYLLFFYLILVDRKVFHKMKVSLKKLL